MFTLQIPTTPVLATDEAASFVIATMLREIADRIDGGESEVTRENRLARLDEFGHPSIRIVPDDNDHEWLTETWRYATRFNDTLVGAFWSLTGKQ